MSSLCTIACGPCGQCRSECDDCGRDHPPPSCEERREAEHEELCNAEAHRLAQCWSFGGNAPKRCPQCRAWSPAFESARKFECPVHGVWEGPLCSRCKKPTLISREADPEVGLLLDLYGCPEHGEFWVEDGETYQHFIGNGANTESTK